MARTKNRRIASTVRCFGSERAIFTAQRKWQIGSDCQRLARKVEDGVARIELRTPYGERGKRFKAPSLPHIGPETAVESGRTPTHSHSIVAGGLLETS